MLVALSVLVGSGGIALARFGCCVSSCVNLLVHASNLLTFVVFPTLVVNTPIVRLGPFVYVKKKITYSFQVSILDQQIQKDAQGSIPPLRVYMSRISV